MKLLPGGLLFLPLLLLTTTAILLVLLPERIDAMSFGLVKFSIFLFTSPSELLKGLRDVKDTRFLLLTFFAAARNAPSNG